MNWTQVFSFCYLLILILPITSYGVALSRSSSSNCRLNMLKSIFEYEYYQKGDVIIGGLTSAHFFSSRRDPEHIGMDGSPTSSTFCDLVDIEEYKSILVMIFAVNEINKNPDLLPNVTLGYHIFDTCSDPIKSLAYVMKILSGEKVEAPNYFCKGHGEVAGFIGDTTFDATTAIAQLLSLYRYTQISHRVSDPHLSNIQMYPTLFRMTPDDRTYYAAVIKFLLHFGWNWVGIVVAYDGSGDEESHALSQMMKKHGISLDYVIKFKANEANYIQNIPIIERSAAKVVVVCGRFTIETVIFLGRIPSASDNITFIFPQSWAKVNHLPNEIIPQFNCSFLFLWEEKVIPNLKMYTKGISLHSRFTDPILEDILIYFFRCLSQNSYKNKCLQAFYNISATPCTELPHFWSSTPQFLNSMPPYVYTAVYVLANALHRIYGKKIKSEQNGLKHIVSWIRS